VRNKKDKKSVDPFSEEGKQFAKDCDEATIAKDVKKLKALVVNILPRLNTLLMH